MKMETVVDSLLSFMLIMKSLMFGDKKPHCSRTDCIVKYLTEAH